MKRIEDPAKSARLHGLAATMSLIASLLALSGMIALDGWRGIVCAALCGVAARTAVGQTVEAARYASAQTSVDVLLEVAKRGKR